MTMNNHGGQQELSGEAQIRIFLAKNVEDGKKALILYAILAQFVEQVCPAQLIFANPKYKFERIDRYYIILMCV